MEALILLWLLSKMGTGGLQPGMTGLIKNFHLKQGSETSPVGVVAVKTSTGVLGWTNVLPEQNHGVRQAFPNGARVVIRQGGIGAPEFHAVRDGDGMQGGAFFRAV